jgi:polysaccharide pyruvyl transferase WcaK-like protein
VRCAPRARVEVVPDPAWFAVTPAEPDPARPPGSVGIVVRAPAPSATGGDAVHAETLLAALSMLTKRLIGEGRDVELITMHDAVDGPFVARLVDRCASLGATGVTVTSLPLEPDRAVARLGAHAAIVSVRLHGLILAALAGVPAVSIRYDQKVASAASALGLGDLCLPLEGLTADAIAGTLAASAEPGRRQALAARVAGIRDRADEVRTLIATALA